MLTPIPPSRVLDEWGAINADLKRAMERDPGRDWLDILGQAIAGDLRFWRVTGATAGYLATQVTGQHGRRVFWVIYAGGMGGTMADKRLAMAAIEQQARDARCSELRFEGRDWRRVCRDYRADKGPDGRWNFRKRLK